MEHYISKPVLMGKLTSGDMQKKIKAMNGEEAYNEFLTMLNETPAVEVEPVRHGHWEQCFEDWRKQIEGDKCSACGFEHYGCSIKSYSYCPQLRRTKRLGGIMYETAHNSIQAQKGWANI